MNIEFYSSHVETLADLIKIAEKHNCTITFGVMPSHERDIDESILMRTGFTKELITELNEKLIIENADSSADKVWFELYNKNDKTRHSMVYIETSTYFIARRQEIEFDDEVPSDELIAKLEEHDQMMEIEAYTIHEYYNPTIIHGFGNKERVDDFRVYRSGMALKFFGDLVCDYLNEPRINRVY